jgi:1-pyrroline-5-carboxylate dehydrogenase
MAIAFAEQGNLLSPSMANEPVKTYAPGSVERESLTRALALQSAEPIELPLVIGGQAIRTRRQLPVVLPHSHAHVLGEAHQAGTEQVTCAIAATKRAWHGW